MNSHSCQSTSTHYPSWHNKPLHLTSAEMNEPFTVLDDFFQCYSLPDTRHILKQWWQESMRAGELPALDQVYFHEHMEKLVEAAFVLYKACKAGHQQVSEDRVTAIV
jgi:hypothetical protein